MFAFWVLGLGFGVWAEDVYRQTSDRMKTCFYHGRLGIQQHYSRASSMYV